jgi:hypothetical protein
MIENGSNCHAKPKRRRQAMVSERICITASRVEITCPGGMIKAPMIPRNGKMGTTVIQNCIVIRLIILNYYFFLKWGHVGLFEPHAWKQKVLFEC